MAEGKFFRCNKCGNMVYVTKLAGGQLVCCGEPMEELKPNTTEAAGEKHVPVIERGQHGHVTVKVGEVAHPMTEPHLIEWICVVTGDRASFKYLTPAEEPVAVFGGIPEDQPVTAYAYCNLHGLWSAQA